MLTKHYLDFVVLYSKCSIFLSQLNSSHTPAISISSWTISLISPNWVPCLSSYWNCCLRARKRDLFWDKSNRLFIKALLFRLFCSLWKQWSLFSSGYISALLKGNAGQYYARILKNPHHFFCTSLILSCFQQCTKEGYVLKGFFTLRQIPCFHKPVQTHPPTEIFQLGLLFPVTESPSTWSRKHLTSIYWSVYISSN